MILDIQKSTHHSHRSVSGLIHLLAWMSLAVRFTCLIDRRSPSRSLPTKNDSTDCLRMGNRRRLLLSFFCPHTVRRRLAPLNYRYRPTSNNLFTSPCVLCVTQRPETSPPDPFIATTDQVLQSLTDRLQSIIHASSSDSLRLSACTRFAPILRFNYLSPL